MKTSIIVKYTNENIAYEEYESKEIKDLAKTALFDNVSIISFKLKEITPKYHLTIGRVESLKSTMDGEYLLSGNKIEVLIVDFDLSAVQKKNLEKELKVEVIDRTSLILRIFEMNAHTIESIKQVEIAKLQYLKTHLVDNKASYSQVTSGSGHNKGVGEKQIELDRRKIDKMIAFKKEELKKIRLRRRNSRSKRGTSLYPKISIVGYTNAGKSTLLNLLLRYAKANENKTVLSEDKLFATLETSTRLINIFPYPNFFITDTVGFIKDLPTFLVDAFRSTLEEIIDSDLLIQVVDISSPFHLDMIETTNQIIKELGGENIPMIYLLNKYDKLQTGYTSLLKNNQLLTCLKNEDEAYDVISFICKAFAKNWEKRKMILPYEVDFVNFQKENYVLSYKQKEDGYELEAYINPVNKNKY